MKKQRLLRTLHQLAKVGHDLISQDDLHALHEFIREQIMKEVEKKRMAVVCYHNGHMHTIHIEGREKGVTYSDPGMGV